MSCPHCQGPSKFQDHRDKTFVSLMGQIVLQRRAYYHCPACHAGHVPLVAALGFSACRLTPAAEELVSLAVPSTASPTRTEKGTQLAPPKTPTRKTSTNRKQAASPFHSPLTC